MDQLQTFHRRFAGYSAESLLKEAKELFLKNEQALALDTSAGYAKATNRAFIKARMIVQDNSYSMNYVPLSHDVVNEKTGEKDPWKFDGTRFKNLVGKQRYCCILLPEADGNIITIVDLSMDALTLQALSSKDKDTLQKKLPGIPTHLVVMLKTVDLELLRLNQVVDVFGVIEFPSRNIDEDQTEESNIEHFVPVIHSISCNEYNPKIDLSLSNGDSLYSKPDIILAVREEAINAIKSVLLGDTLAAEYLYVSLFSKITKRLGGLATGSINPSFFHNSITTLDCKKLLGVIKLMTPLTALLHINIETLNKTLWMQPHQNRYEGHDYGLCRGEFQAPDGTFFLLDECDMDVGTLLERGVLNVKACMDAIELGVVNYGLHYDSMTKDCDFRFAMLGKTSSILSLPFSMPLVPGECCKTAQQPLESAKFIKGLISSMNSITFELSKDMEDMVHRDFIAMQQMKRDAKETVDDGSGLLNRLILAENVAKSYGFTSLDAKSWEKAGFMEFERKRRVASRVL